MEVQEKKQSKFGWFMEKIIGLDGIIISGKYILQLILLFFAITLSLDWFINNAPQGLMESKIFIATFMTAVMLMPVYISYKNMREQEIYTFSTWIIVIGGIGGIILKYFNIF